MLEVLSSEDQKLFIAAQDQLLDIDLEIEIEIDKELEYLAN